MDKRIRTIMISEMAAVVSMAALAVVTHGTTEEVVFASMVGMMIGLLAGIIIGACWGIGWTRSPKAEPPADGGKGEKPCPTP